MVPRHIATLCDTMAQATLAGSEPQLRVLYGALREYLPGGDQVAQDCTCHYPG